MTPFVFSQSLSVCSVGRSRQASAASGKHKRVPCFYSPPAERLVFFPRKFFEAVFSTRNSFL